MASDNTYLDLPLIGQPDTTGVLAQFVNWLASESATVRAPFVGKTLDDNLALYLYGDKNGPPTAGNAVVNRIQGTIHTFVDIAYKTPPSSTIKPTCVGDPLRWYLLDVPLDPQTGQPSMDPTQPLPKEMVAQLQNTPDAIVGLNTDRAAEWLQPIFDIQWERSRLTQFLRKDGLYNQIDGFRYSLVEWDSNDKKNIARSIPALQWYPDPTAENIRDMRYLGLDWVIDAEYAKRLYPQLAKDIDENASRQVRYPVGQMGFSSVYTIAYNRPIVTIRIFWLRDQQCPMTDEEACGCGLAEYQDVPDDSAIDKMLMGGITPDDGGPEDQTPSAPALAMPTRKALIHTQSGEEIADTVDTAGATIPALNRPTKFCIRRVTLLMDKVVSDIEEKGWDIPVLQNFCVPIPNRPFGQGTPERLASAQSVINRLHTVSVNHAEWFKGPTSIIPNSIKERLPNNLDKEFFLKPNVTYGVDDELLAKTGGRPILVLEAPALPPVVLQVKNETEREFDVVAGRPGVLQGQATADAKSGIAIGNLQNAATSAQSVTFFEIDEVVWRLSKICLHNILYHMTVEDLLRINRTYPAHIVEIILEMARGEEWNFTIETSANAGQAKAQKNQETLQKLQVGVIDMETARDRLGEDDDEIERRINQQKMKAAAGAVPDAAAPQGPPMQLTGAA